MAAGLVEKKICKEDGTEHTYEFEKFGAEEALENLIKISKIIGKPLGLAMASLKGEDEGLFEKKIDLNLLALAFDGLTQNLDDKVCVELIKKLTSGKVLCDGVLIKSFNTHYKDDLFHMFKVLQAALEVQYGNFFAGILGLVNTNKAMSNKKSLT